MNAVWMGIIVVTALWISSCGHCQISPRQGGITELPDQVPTLFQSEITDDHGNYSIRLELVEDIGYRLLVSISDNPNVTPRAILLPWPVYHCEVGDVDGNGCADIIIGVTKRCDYDPRLGRRLFVYEIVDGTTQPKWLGTILTDELLEFTTILGNDQTILRTREQDISGSIFEGEYHWEGFGFIRMAYRHTHSIGGKDDEANMVHEQ